MVQLSGWVVYEGVVVEGGPCATRRGHMTHLVVYNEGRRMRHANSCPKDEHKTHNVIH